MLSRKLAKGQIRALVALFCSSSVRTCSTFPVVLCKYN
uniref:Uncharacterized protein n=1 Tax=Anguilla anguilla TaxID=7936 RepID=A0A0E9PML1_ANGAN